MKATVNEMKDYMVHVRQMLNTCEKKSIVENYITSLYANEKVNSKQFDLLYGMIF